MGNRVAVMSIIVENDDSTIVLNEMLHEYSKYVVSRMGVPYRERQICIISVVLDAPQDVINTLSGKLGKLEGVSVKTAYSSVQDNG